MQHKVNTVDYKSLVSKNSDSEIVIMKELPGKLIATNYFTIRDSSVYWSIELSNRSTSQIELQELYLPINIGARNEMLAAKDNLCRHNAINGHASFLYWLPYYGEGPSIVMTMQDGTWLESESKDGLYYIHSINTNNGEAFLPIPASQCCIESKNSVRYGFVFNSAKSRAEIADILDRWCGVSLRVAPSMVVPIKSEVLCALRSKDTIRSVTSSVDGKNVVIKDLESSDNKRIISLKFDSFGDNRIRVDYGDNYFAWFDFYVTEPVETLIKKRSKFIVDKQQHRDPNKWYNGLYSIWDMTESKLLSPDDKQQLPTYVVAGSDDPSNSKQIYVSEKNLLFPNRDEIASLEYYQDNFVWGKLQRTGEESPYPYGIYGSEHWYENRSGEIADYNSGGWGKERMWRTFDYTTHFATYYNMYMIAKADQSLLKTSYDEYLMRAYNTAMAYFEVPYNILMGEKWSFNGWCDWAYKQGNFHERYILDILKALEQEGYAQEADALRGEWEKKVLYFTYDDPWPFGSEMFVDRTAFESSYYIAEYAKYNDIEPKEQLWYDKNLHKWYSYTDVDPDAADQLMHKQLIANLAMRGVDMPHYYGRGTAWTGSSTSLEYMTQMGGVALLDYAVRFSDDPATYINYGYNSLMASWALICTDNSDNDGAAGWTFSTYMDSNMYFKDIKCDRGPWRYCGEIDHGFTGAVHGGGTYVVDDPDFGVIAYGGDLKVSKEHYIVTPTDGMRRRLFFAFDSSLGVELAHDGFAKGESVKVSKSYDSINFIIANRFGTTHQSLITLSGLELGRYSIEVDGCVEEFEVLSNRPFDYYLTIRGKKVDVNINKL